MMLLQKFVDTDHQSITLTEPDLALVNQFTLKPLTADDVWLGRVKLCNTRYDRHDERLPLRYLERIAATTADRPVISGHDKRTLPLARFYAARVMPDSDHDGEQYVSADYYINRRTQKGQDLVSDIEAGILRHVSVTASCGPMNCDLCQEPYLVKEGAIRPGCKHKKGKTYDGKRATATYDAAYADLVEMHEGSFVYWPAQHGTEAVSRGLWLPETDIEGPDGRPLWMGEIEHAQRIWQLGLLTSEQVRTQIQDPAPAAKGGDMAQIDTLEKALARIDELESDDRETTLQKQISDLTGRVEPLERQVTAARDWQFAEIRKAAGILERTAATEALLTHLTRADWETLEKIRSEMMTEAAKKLGPVEPQAKADGPGDDDREKPKPSWRDRFQGGYF